MGQAVEIDIFEVQKVNKYYMLIFDLKMFNPFVNGVKLSKFGHGIKFLFLKCIFCVFLGGKTEGGV